MKCVNMHVLNGLWARIDDFVWICVWKTWLDGWLDISMRLVCMKNLWLVGEKWLWYRLDVIPWISWWDHGGALCDGRNSMELLVRAHGSASGDGHNSTNLLVRFHGGASVYIIR